LDLRRLLGVQNGEGGARKQQKRRHILAQNEIALFKE
jgi:hypothetical protein